MENQLLFEYEKKYAEGDYNSNIKLIKEYEEYQP